MRNLLLASIFVFPFDCYIHQMEDLPIRTNYCSDNELLEIEECYLPLEEEYYDCKLNYPNNENYDHNCAAFAECKYNLLLQYTDCMYGHPPACHDDIDHLGFFFTGDYSQVECFEDVLDDNEATCTDKVMKCDF